MAVLSGPVDRLLLRFEGGEHVVRVILDHIVLYGGPLRPAVGSRLNLNVRHPVVLLCPCISNQQSGHSYRTSSFTAS